MPDFRTPSPDAGHEAIRGPLAAAIDDLAAAVQTIAEHDQRIDDALLLAWATSHFAEVTLTNVAAVQAGGQQVQTTLASIEDSVAALAARVSALEPAATPDPAST